MYPHSIYVYQNVPWDSSGICHDNPFDEISGTLVRRKISLSSELSYVYFFISNESMNKKGNSNMTVSFHTEDFKWHQI